MHFDQVKAHAFGPLEEQALTLNPGLNVIHGPNEAGKSSWHGAIYAALCGRRRGAGITSEERAFADQYRPWSGGRWEVSAEVTLNDGTQLELRHELENRIDCTVTDLRTGRDLSRDLIDDGAPDGSTLLGLDRRSFYSVACVRQAELLGIQEAADALQSHLQRAATSAAATSTAAEALQIIESYRRDRIGTERAHTRPLAQARLKLRDTESTLNAALGAETELVTLREELDSQHQGTTHAARQVGLLEAKLAWAEASDLQRRLETALPLAAEFPEGSPRALSDDSRAGDEVAATLEAWEQRPEDASLLDEDKEALKRQLDAVGDLDSGDSEEDEGVLGAADAHRQALTRLSQHGASQPTAQPGSPDGVRKSRDMRMLLGGLAAVPLGVALLILGVGVPGALIALGGAGVGLYALLQWKLSPKPSGFDHQLAEWQVRDREAKEEVAQAAATLVAGLRERGLIISPSESPSTAHERYREDCRTRRQQTRLTRRLSELQRLHAVHDSLIRAASSAGLEGSSDLSLLVETLKSWQLERQQRLADWETGHRKWTELQSALAGLTIEDLRISAAKRHQEAEELGNPFEAEDLTAFEVEDPPKQLQSLRQAAGAARDQLTRLEERLQDQQERFPDLAAATEEQQLAEEELGRIRDLDRILERTHGFLARAAERAHNNIAPVLQTTLERWVSIVTRDRYVEARVDPDDLQIRLRSKGGAWRLADRLSHGTAEQVYLLLRIALAEHLGKRDESCPLILDDVTAHTDPERTVAMLYTLAAISAERQVILFSQEAEVLDWARKNTSKSNLIELPVLDPAR